MPPHSSVAHTTTTPPLHHYTNNSESHQLAQILVDIQEGQQTESEEGEFEDDTWDIDLMASDNEDDEEEIESKNEQDGAFLDDKI